MMNGFCRLGAALAAVILLSTAGQADAASEERTVDACAAAIKKEFGASPVEFDKFRRKKGGRRNYAFGELTMSDGSKAQIRCRYKSGRVQSLQFRGTNEPGNMWIDKRPAAAIFVEEKDEKPDADKKAVEKKEDEPVRPKRESVGKDTDPEKPADTGTTGTDKADAADKTEADSKDEKAEGDAKAEAPDEPVKPRFIKAPTN